MGGPLHLARRQHGRQVLGQEVLVAVLVDRRDQPLPVELGLLPLAERGLQRAALLQLVHLVHRHLGADAMRHVAAPPLGEPVHVRRVEEGRLRLLVGVEHEVERGGQLAAGVGKEAQLTQRALVLLPRIHHRAIVHTVQQ